MSVGTAGRSVTIWREALSNPTLSWPSGVAEPPEVVLWGLGEGFTTCPVLCFSCSSADAAGEWAGGSMMQARQEAVTPHWAAGVGRRGQGGTSP